jgi:hypothetical protein
MATKKSAEDQLGFRKAYKMTGTPGYAGGSGETTIDKGNSGSKRANNAVLNQNKMAKDSKVGPDKNLKDIGGGNFY